MRSFRRIAGTACTALLLLAACGGSGNDDAGAGADTGATVAPPTDITVASADPSSAADGAVPTALQFTAPAVGGGQIDAAAYAGTPTVFWFWAPT